MFKRDRVTVPHNIGKLKSPNKNNGALGYRTISWLRASCRSLQKEGKVVGGL